MCDEDFTLSGQLPGTSRAARREGAGLSVGSAASWHRWAVDELEQLNVLSEGWDGDQAPRPDKFMVASACGFVDYLALYFTGLPAPSISLSPNSTVLFTWAQEGKTLDMEFKTSDTVNYYFKNRVTAEKHPGTLRHNRFDAYILSKLIELKSVEFVHCYQPA